MKLSSISGACALALGVLALSGSAFAVSNLNSSKSNVYREAGCAGYPQDAKCCKAAGGTWATGGASGFCFLNLRNLGLGLTENDCRAVGGRVEQKRDGPTCVSRDATPAPAN